MQKEARIAILAIMVVMIAVAAFGAVGYMSSTTTSQNQTQNNDEESTGTSSITRQQLSELKQILAQNQPIPSEKLQRALNFLKNANKTTYTGSIVLVQNQIMVLNVTGQTVNIIMAQKWVVGSEVLTLHELFAKGTLSNGQRITVSALVAAQGHIYVAWGYKMITSKGTVPAFLPFNVK